MPTAASSNHVGHQGTRKLNFILIKCRYAMLGQVLAAYRSIRPS
jgi:hypothetical protein